MNSLKLFLEQHLALSDSDWQYIAGRVDMVSLTKKSMLTDQGKKEGKVYFIDEGVLRLFHDGENKEITLSFGFPNSFISSYSSFLTGEESEFALEALTSCRLIGIDKSQLEDIYLNTDCGQELGRVFAEDLFVYMSRRETSFLLRSPTERYLDLFNHQPQLIREIPLKYLASYIGITPQALSRIRAKI